MALELPPGMAYINTDEGQRFANFTHELHRCTVDFSKDSEDIESDDVARILIDNQALVDANSIGSKVSMTSNMHMPVLDLDIDAMLIPSSTRGHHHLYIGKQMTWRDYKLLMITMEHVGILQPGYVRASIARAESFVRTPWTQKER